MKRKILYTLLLSIQVCILYADALNPYAKRGIVQVVSSEFPISLAEAYKQYSVGNAIDEDPQTAWVFEKSKSRVKDVIGLLFNFDTEQNIDGISLINGYAKNDSLYNKNSSVEEFEILLPNHKKYHFKCSPTMKFQSFKFPQQKVKWMIFKVTKIKQGTVYDDLCISEISPLVKRKSLVSQQSELIINNNGTLYESDVITHIKTKRKLNTGSFDFGCGASFPIAINDTILVYQDGCNPEEFHTRIVYLNGLTYYTIKSKKLMNFFVVEAISDSSFILKEMKIEKYFQYNSNTETMVPINYVEKNRSDGFWKWSENMSEYF